MRVPADDFPSRSTESAESDERWCICRGHDDGHQQREGCCVWFHLDCLGLSLANSQSLGSSTTSFVGPYYSNFDSTSQLPFRTQLLLKRCQNLVIHPLPLLIKFKPCLDCGVT